jgi:hypothetical protein
MPELTAKKRYEKESKKRKQFVDRARKNAEFTDPNAFPDTDVTPGSDYQQVQPWQSLGARGVRVLSSKIMLALFPPNTPWFRQQVEKEVEEQLSAVNPDAPIEIQKALGRMEEIVTSAYEASNTRPIDSESVRQLLLAGNVLQFQDEDGNTRMWRLNEYITKRDNRNRVKLIIAKETMSLEDFQLLGDRKPQVELNQLEMGGKKDLELFTVVQRMPNGTWDSWQEIKNHMVPDSLVTYKEENLPWFALQAIAKPGWDYGEAVVTEVIADLVTFDSLTQSITEATAAGANIINLVNPNGVTEMQDLEKAQNGDYIEGVESDVATLQTNKALDIRTAQVLLDALEKRIAQFFLMTTSAIRNAERVTREEIRLVAEELSQALGGTYSQWATEWQLPRVKFSLWRLTKQNKLPTLPKGATTPIIITGLDALGRGHTLNKLQAFLTEDLALILQIDPSLAQALKGMNLVTKLATARGISLEDLFKTEEELAAEQAAAQQQQQQALLQAAVADKAIDTGGNIAEATAIDAVTNQ